jgi:hypothetical protein
VSEIIWSGGSIGANQFQRFPWVGTLPDDVDTLAFPAIQAYANGKVVSWIQPIVAGQDEPEDPTPTITLTAASETSGPDHTTATTVAAGTRTTGSSTATAATRNSVSSAKTLGIVGVVVGLVSLAVAAFALTRKPT